MLRSHSCSVGYFLGQVHVNSTKRINQSLSIRWLHLQYSLYYYHIGHPLFVLLNLYIADLLLLIIIPISTSIASSVWFPSSPYNLCILINITTYNINTNLARELPLIYPLPSLQKYVSYLSSFSSVSGFFFKCFFKDSACNLSNFCLWCLIPRFISDELTSCMSK